MSKETDRLLENVARLNEALSKLSINLENLTEARIGIEKAQRNKIDHVNERMGHINIKKWIEKNERK
ncbi:hypothetical protein [Paenibacillus polymyxa]|uniref:hypothetical protein n=1 Tax=Paenibacillus polymyxa TaxID=1406 RepID=UPI002AB47426|nr:hypothetical protein [Paenibacillus polymyxa]MDY8021111.1 hypothetical protein [Paenibacillus polymyxa]